MISIYDSAVNAFVVAQDRHDFAEATRFAQDVAPDLPESQRRVLRIMYREAHVRLFVVTCVTDRGAGAS